MPVLTRAEKDQVPCCPKCGEPPKWRIAHHVVRVGLEPRRRELVETGKIRVELVENGEVRVGKKLGDTGVFECGGGHRWKEDPNEG